MSLAAVLVAISIPIFSGELEKAREATDEANIRAAYAELSSAALLDDDDSASSLKNTDNIKYEVTAATDSAAAQYKAEITLTQKKAKWQNGTTTIGGLDAGEPTATSKYAELTIPADGSKGSLTYSDSATIK